MDRLEKFESYQRQRIAHYQRLAVHLDHYRAGQAYRKRLREIYAFVIPPHSSVLEVGCGQGDLLAAMNPSRGVGIDFSEEMICRARAKYPQLTFDCCDAHQFIAGETFDAIILSDLVNDLWDVQTVLENVKKACHPGTRIILNSFSRVWQLPLQAAEKLGLARPNLAQNWLTPHDLVNLLDLCGFQVIRKREEILLPLPVPGIAAFFNKFLARFWLINQLTLTNFYVARPESSLKDGQTAPSISVIVPARNEAGNIAEIFRRVPEMGSGTELIFVEGHSTDNTYAVIEEEMRRHPQRPCRLFKQQGIGKADAVRLGFENARGDILSILDADLTVAPEDLPRFYQAIVSGKGELINGVRLVYPLEGKAMQFLNILGNKFFSSLISWLLDQPVKDTLCGTKVMWRSDYEHLVKNRAYFGDFDPFGDFDLIFGSAKLNLKILDLPVRYGERVYGTTNIQRWRHGALLLRMAAFAARRIKFV